MASFHFNFNFNFNFNLKSKATAKAKGDGDCATRKRTDSRVSVRRHTLGFGYRSVPLRETFNNDEDDAPAALYWIHSLQISAPTSGRD